MEGEVEKLIGRQRLVRDGEDMLPHTHGHMLLFCFCGSDASREARAVSADALFVINNRFVLHALSYRKRRGLRDLRRSHNKSLGGSVV